MSASKRGPKSGRAAAAPLTDQPARAAAETDLDRCLAIEASAGTGKTSLIVERAVNLVATGRAAIHEIAVITFTEKAAAELEERIRRRLDDRIANGQDETERQRLLAARDDLDRAAIQTIHAFAASLLRRRPVEAGVDPLFTVADREAQRALLDEAWSRYLEGQDAPTGALLKEVRLGGVSLDDLRALAERFAENRDVVQRAQLAAVPAPDPQAVLAQLGALIESKPAWAAAICRDSDDKLRLAIEAAAERVRKARTLSAEDAKRALLGGKIRIGKSLNIGRAPSWKAALEEARRLLVDFNRVADAYGEACSRRLAVLAALWARGFGEVYRKLKDEQATLDFQDLLLRARDLARQPEMAESFRAVCKYLLVDEFQDTDPLQMELVAYLTGAGDAAAWRARDPLPGALFVVGDPKQSIYRFRRADVGLYMKTLDWLRERAGADATQTIEANFRSRPGITRWVNALFSRLFAPPESDGPVYSPLDAQRPESAFPAVHYLLRSEGSQDAQGHAESAKPRAKAKQAAAGQSAPDPETKPEVRAQEAAAIAALIRQGIDTGRWTVQPGPNEPLRPARLGDIVLLLRAFGDVSLYEDALSEQGLQSMTSGGREYFVRPETAWFCALLVAIESPRDAVSVVAALRSPFFGVSDEAIFEASLAEGGLDPLRAQGQEGTAGAALRRIAAWHRTRNDSPPGAVVRAILEESGALIVGALGRDGERAALNLAKIADLARRRELEGGTFRSFARWMKEASRDLFEESDSPILEGAEGAIRIMTIHAAKGLQFPIVVLADLGREMPMRDKFLIDRAAERVEFELGRKESGIRSAGFENLKEAEERALRDERRRLLYVAATRAQDLLIVSTFGAAGKATFLTDLGAGGALPGAEEPGPDAPHDALRTADSAPGAKKGAAATPNPPSEGNLVLPNGTVVFAQTPEAAGEPELPATEVPAVPVDPTHPRDPAGLDANALEEWAAERAALLARAARGPRFLAASHTGVYGDRTEPADGPAVSMSSQERGGTQGESNRGLEFGILVHALLEAADFNRADDLEALAEALAAERGVPEFAAGAAEAARRALRLPSMKRAASRRSFRETPISFFQDEVLVEGQIDLFYEDEDRTLIIVDYKTDSVADEKGARERALMYREQLALYAAGLERATGRTVREMVLLFTSIGTEVHLPHDDSMRALARDTIARA